MKAELDEWNLYAKDDECANALSRFLIGFEELRIRLAPSRYPNIEISDEGYLWFNVDTSLGTIEILAFPFGYKEIESPSIAVSLPRKVDDVSSDLLDRLHKIADDVAGAKVFADKPLSGISEILQTFRENRQPQLSFVLNSVEILKIMRKGAFFSYFGIVFSVTDKTVSGIEHIIRKAISNLE